jgi:hypothetical protein
MSVERVFVGDDEQYFPDLGRWVKPGEQVEFDEDPDDPRFLTAAAAKKAGHKPQPTTPDSPADTEES